MADNDIHFRAGADTAAWLDALAALTHAGSRHRAAQSAAAVLPGLLAGELRRIRLTAAQAGCVADVLNGSALELAVYTGSVPLAYAECFDAFRLARAAAPSMADVSSYGAKWMPPEQGPDGAEKWEDELLGLLLGLGPAADLALRWAVARWWELDPESGEEPAGLFARVGLTVTG